MAVLHFVVRNRNASGRQLFQNTKKGGKIFLLRKAVVCKEEKNKKLILIRKNVPLFRML